MSRIFAATVAAALALPMLALAALIGEQEAMLSGAAVLNVPVRGYDPRDLLHGHYIQGQLDWEWDREPAAQGSYAGIDGAACVLAADVPKPRLRFIAGWKAGDRAGNDCRMIIAGRGWAGQGGMVARFVPASLDAGGGQVRLFVPEKRAADLEQLLIARPGAFTVDLAVRPDGGAAIKALRVDGEILGR
jgi:GDYXXLXY protein